jgi:hypothetical protein
MPNSHGDDSAPVTWGRFSAETAALAARIADLEEQNERQFARIEANERTAVADREARVALDADMERLDGTLKTMTTSDQSRKDRRWVITLTVVTGLICPVMVTVVITWLHIRALH